MKRTPLRHITVCLCFGTLFVSSAAFAQREEAADWRAKWHRQWVASDWRTKWRQQWVTTHWAQKKSPALSQEVEKGAKSERTPDKSDSVLPSAAVPMALPVQKEGVFAPVAPKSEANSQQVVQSAKEQRKSAAAPAASAPQPPVKKATPAEVLPVDRANTPQLVTPAAKSEANPLAETRPDPAPESKKAVDKPLDSPMSAVGDGGRMFLYLIPTVLLMVGALHFLRRFQEKKGRLPAFAQPGAASKKAPAPAAKTGGLLQGIMGGFNLNRAQERGGSSIRIVESVPIGSANLHLIEVRGRVLLLGGTANGLNLLTEIAEPDALVNNEFRLLLEQAANDLDGLDLAEDGLPAPLLVGALDEPMRDANRAITRGARRLRTVQEAEAAWEQEQR